MLTSNVFVQKPFDRTLFMFIVKNHILIGNSHLNHKSKIEGLTIENQMKVKMKVEVHPSQTHAPSVVY